MKEMYPETVIEQFVYESEEWRRLMAFLKQENVFYKSRLAEVVNTAEDEDVLLAAERFQEDFLSQDRMVEFLSAELNKQTKLLQKDNYVDGEIFRNLVQSQKRLRDDIQKAEEFFSKTKTEFAHYLVELF